ncbi:formyl transferase [uncultured Alsobacter sp.]|uniref:glucosamine inositolphosphorylceramide transferase family protein n=1 Tax=uncultured Alsobacter sp. TaxID=1748258 RepID=UPI0025E6DFD9|nr:formyl transferase [uncultured Alsobacter sp.]
MAPSIDIRVARSRPWRWILEFARQLEERGHRVSVQAVDGQPGLPSALTLLFSLENTLFGRPEASRTDLLAPSDWPKDASRAEPDLVIDFSGAPSPAAPGTRTLVPVYDGTPSEDAIFAALLDERAPGIAFRDVASGEIVAEGLVAIDDFSVLSRSADQAFSRVQTLGLMAAAGGPRRRLDGPALPASAGRSPLVFLAAQLIGKVANRLTRLASGRPHHWRIAFRPAAAGDRIWDRRALPDAAWTFVPDDGARYFADPFPFETHGRMHLFCEEYPYATMRGIISVIEIEAGRQVGPAVPIIETGYHLSYPFIFERDGTIWMVPETSGNNTIELWRCTDFPRGWERHAILVDGVAATDATILFGGERLFMFASVRHAGSASHDALMVWSAPRLEGPWTAFSADPVLVDARSSRPAGRMQVIDGTAWRPAQDCSSAYGGALTLCRVDALDPEAGVFRQTTMARIVPPTDRAWTGLHTLNEAGGLEFIDLCGRSRP